MDGHIRPTFDPGHGIRQAEEKLCIVAELGIAPATLGWFPNCPRERLCPDLLCDIGLHNRLEVADGSSWQLKNGGVCRQLRKHARPQQEVGSVTAGMDPSAGMDLNSAYYFSNLETGA